MEELRFIKDFIKNEMLISEKKFTSGGKKYVFAREVAYYLARKYTNRSLMEIGFWIGYRHYTTVINSLKKVEVYQNLKNKNGKLIYEKECKKIDFLEKKFLVEHEKKANFFDIENTFEMVLENLIISNNQKQAKELFKILEKYL